MVNDGDDEPIDKCKRCPLCYVDKQRHRQPPNAPLTLDELREMDGEPVWVERPGYGKKWALVQVWAKSTNVIYFTYNNGSTSLVKVVIDCGGKAYRRKPEEGTV